MRFFLVSLFCSVLAGSLQAQTAVQMPENQVQLSASATIEVPQDWLTMTLTTSRDGLDAAVVQSQLKQALDAALQQARAAAQPGQLEVRTGAFQLYPRNGRDGRINGWQGRVELVLEGRDFVAIGATAGRMQTLTMGGVQFGLSREQRAKVETEVQAQAIAGFRAKAGDIARGFGFTSYALREVAVNADNQMFAQRPRMMAMEAKTAVADAPIPLEAGKASVTVSVSGSVQLR